MGLFAKKSMCESNDDSTKYAESIKSSVIGLLPSLKFKGQADDLSKMQLGDVYIDNAGVENVVVSDSTSGQSNSLTSVPIGIGGINTTTQSIGIQSSPWTTQYTYEFPSMYDNYITIELKLRDGSRVIDKFDKRLIYDIRERKDPDNEAKTYSSFRYMQTSDKRDYANDQVFEVACSIHDLCYLLKIDYIPFSKTLLEKTIKGDNK